MCTQIHADSFIKKVIEAVKELIKYRPEKVGEFYFKNYLPPRLCHLDYEVPDGKAVVNDGVGKTLLFIIKRYGGKDDDKMTEILDRLFDENMTPAYVASILVATAKTMATLRAFRDEKGKKCKLPEPEPEDLGNKRIFFLPLLAIIDLFINMLLDNRKYAEDFARREKEWIDYVNFIFAPDSGVRH